MAVPSIFNYNMNTGEAHGLSHSTRSLRTGGRCTARWKRKHAKLLVSAASVSCNGFQLSSLAVIGILLMVPSSYRGTFAYLITVSAILVISTGTIAIANFVGGAWATYQLLFELCWIAATSTLTIASLAVVALMQNKMSCGVLFHSDEGICKINSLSVILQSLGLVCIVIQAGFLWVILRQAQGLTKQPLKTILSTPTSELHALVPGYSATMHAAPSVAHYTNPTPLSPVRRSDDVEVGRFAPSHRSKSSSQSSSGHHYGSITGSNWSHGGTTRSVKSVQLPPLAPPMSMHTDIYTQAPPPVCASARRELRRERQVS